MPELFRVGNVMVNAVALRSRGAVSFYTAALSDKHRVPEPFAAFVGAVVRFHKPGHIQRHPVF